MIEHDGTYADLKSKKGKFLSEMQNMLQNMRTHKKKTYEIIEIAEIIQEFRKKVRRNT